MARRRLILGSVLLALTAQAWIRNGGVRPAQGGALAPVCATTFDAELLAEVRVDEIRVEAARYGDRGVSLVQVRGEQGQRALHVRAGGQRLSFEPALPPGTLEISARVDDEDLEGACVSEVTLWSQGALVGRTAPR